MLHRLLDFLYPKRCPICDIVLTRESQRVCKKCREKIQVITEPTCKKCGKPIARLEDEFCFDCKGKHFHYQRGFAVWIYDKNMKNSIAQFKYAGRREYSEFYVEEVLYHLGSRLQALHVDGIIPVPLHREKKRFRGFNQAELLADGIGKGLHVPVYSNIISRKKNTKPQKGLDDKGRMENLKHAFAVTDPNEILKDKVQKVLLVDDIYTTGSTIDECAKALLAAGVSKVYFVCLCIGKDF